METRGPVDTPMVDKSKLDENPQVKVIDPTCYRKMIGTFMYLTSSRPNLVFAVCMCARILAFLNHAGCQDTKRSTTESMQLLVPLLYAATTSNTLDQSILTSNITSSRSKWRMRWLSCTLSERIISWQIFSPKLCHEKDLHFLSTNLG
ncbi:hypothetical protein Tco_1342423 [Tanacetum coccineum]